MTIILFLTPRVRSFIYSGSPGNPSCRAGTPGHQREQHSPRAHAGKNALICCCSAGYFTTQLESSAHASSPPVTHKALPEHFCARPQKRRGKFVPVRDPALMALLGDSYSFFPSDWRSHEAWLTPPPALRMSVTNDGGVGTRAEGGDEAGSTRGGSGRGRGRGLTRVSAAGSRGRGGRGREPLRR